MDMFGVKSVRPMLIGASGGARDDEGYIHELKLDGHRCIAYLGDGKTVLHNKSAIDITSKYPELAQIHTQVSGRVILDGEIFVMRQGQPYFAEMQRRSRMSDPAKISVAAGLLPVTYTAFDILYRDGEQVMDRSLIERKEILQQCVISESDLFSVARYTDTYGVALFALAAQQGLEGIVSKRKDSKYRFSTRTSDWVKCKNVMDDDFIVCGYELKDASVVSIILGQYDDDRLTYKGHVTLGVSRGDWPTIQRLKTLSSAPFAVPRGHEAVVWVEPSLVCAVQYLERTPNGGIRHPVFKWLRDDVTPEECLVH